MSEAVVLTPSPIPAAVLVYDQDHGDPTDILRALGPTQAITVAPDASTLQTMVAAGGHDVVIIAGRESLIVGASPDDANGDALSRDALTILPAAVARARRAVRQRRAIAFLTGIASLDEDELSRLAEVAVPHLADACAIDVLDEQGQLVRAAAAGSAEGSKLVTRIQVGDRVAGAVTLVRALPFDDEDGPLADVLAKRVARALGRRPHRIESILDQLPVGVIIVEAPSGEVSYANRRIVEIFGGPIGDVVGTPHHADAEAYPLARALGGEQVIGEDLPFSRPNGFPAVVRIHAAPLRDETGRIVAAISAYEDVTERKQIESERAILLEREHVARAEAEHANRAKEEFLTVLSHELRTPLNSLLGWARLLRAGKVTTAQLGRAHLTVERNARTLARMVENLLDMSSMTAGDVAIERRVVDLRRAVDTAVAAFRRVATTKGLAFEVDNQHRPSLLVRGDGLRLEQVVASLVDNAIKFTPAGRIDIGLQQQGAFAVLTVRDTGDGLAADVLPHVFDAFRQADTSLTRPREGLGLGLAISRHIAQLHGGVLIAESAGPGGGATFTLRLPLIVDDATAVAEPTRRRRARTTPYLAGAKILVVDDDADARDLLGAVLAMHGAHAVPAANAEEALEAAADPNIALVVSDIAMPRMDGYQLMRELRLRGLKAPAVALTAYSGQEARARAKAAGYQAHLTKPFDPVELLDLLARLGAPG